MCDHHDSSCCHSHGGQDEDAENIAERYSLYQQIDMDKVTCLNELVENSGKSVFKPWDERLNKKKCVRSDTDSELLFNVPFVGNVRLRGFIIVGGAGNTHPDKLRLFRNHPQMSFDDTAAEPDQVFELTCDHQGVVEYPVKATKFNSVSTLGFHFLNSADPELSVLYYIGLRGEFLSAKKEEIVVCTYEARAMPQDHKGFIPESSRSDVA